MANIVIYDPNGVVANRVTSYLKSVNTPDYESLPNVLVNPDVSGLTNQNKYWKVENNLVIEMSFNEKNTLDTFLLSKTIKEKKYKILKYTVVSQIASETWYNIDNGDGTYKDKVEETIYTYLNNVILIKKETTTFYADSTIALVKTIEYFKNTNNEYIEKVV